MDADYVAFEGSLSKGRKAIDDGHRVLFEKWLKGSCLDGAIISIRFLGPDAAVLRAFGGTTLNTRSLSRPSVQTYVATRLHGEWLFSNFQNNRVQHFTAFDYLALALKKILFKM